MTKQSVQLAAIALGLAAVLAVSACKGKPADDEASIQKSLDKTGTMDVMKEASEAEYDPPKSGELTEDQIRMYVEVKERGWKIRQVAQKNLEAKTGKQGDDKDKKVGFLGAMKALGDVGDLISADLRAAQELGANPAEFQWVEGKVMEAQVAVMGQQMKQQVSAGKEQVVAMLEAQKAQVTDPDQKADIEKQIQELRSGDEEEESSEQEPGLEHNIELVKKHEKEIQAALAPQEKGEEG